MAITEAAPDMLVLAFLSDGRMHAIPLENVEKAELAAEVVPLPESPASVIGAIDLSGKVLPVMSMRRRLHLADRGLRPSDRFIVARYSRRSIVMLVDELVGVLAVRRGDFTGASEIYGGLGPVSGTAKSLDGLVLIDDPELFFSEADETALGAP